MPTLKDIVEDLLFNCSWNSTSPTGHAVKVLMSASRGTLVEELQEDMTSMPTYMRGDFATKLPVLKETDSALLFETILECLRTRNWELKLNLKNLEFFIRRNTLELFREFDTDFRGTITQITELPLAKPALLIRTTKGVEEIRWYVAQPDDQGKWRTTSESWTCAEHATASVLCPAHKYAVIALIRDAEAS